MSVYTVGVEGRELGNRSIFPGSEQLNLERQSFKDAQKSNLLKESGSWNRRSPFLQRKEQKLDEEKRETEPALGLAA